MDRLIALDMDGTLLTERKEISPRTRSSLLRAMDGGARVALVSGRPVFGMTSAAEQLELRARGGFLAAYNGALVMDWAKKAPLQTRFADRETALQICREAEDRGLVTIGYDEGRACVTASKTDSDFARIEAKWNRVPLRETRMENDDNASALYLVCGAPEALDVFFARARQLAGDRVELLRGAPDFFYISAPAADKCDATDCICRALHISQREVVAFGDAVNDLKMIKRAGLGIAMGNAEETVRRAAAHVTNDNEHDGIAQALEAYVL